MKGINALSILLLLPVISFAQGWGNQNQFNSTEVHDDRSVTFKILAPDADTVLLSGSDIPDLMGNNLMSKGSNGIWELTIPSLPAGSYRYNFNVDGISVIDPRNPVTSQSNMNTWSLLYVPGNEWFDTKDVPHGAVAEVNYYSETLGKFRRMHVYTPPGYEKGKGEFPVFYLLHGAFDNDDSWSTVGRAGFILDNLIAEGKAKPMVIVMPDGHTRPIGSSGMTMNEFVEDFNNEIKPLVEANYRISQKREHTAIAGLSMGGAQTLDIAIPNLEEYAYIGVYSSGVFGMDNEQGPSYTERNAEKLTNDDLKEGLELLWFATGVEDFLLNTTRATVAMFKDQGFDVIYEETDGAHTWLKWRDYLAEFAPMLFK